MRGLVMITLFAVLFTALSVDGKESFYVQKSGHSEVRPGEITVLFYMTVANGDKNTVKIHSKNVQCCWVHPRSTSAYDCESMDLLGGMPTSLEPSKTGNITYIFTNLYPMDRVGQCIFHLWHEDRKIAHTIRFNTTYVKQTSWLGSIYKKIVGEFEEEKHCNTWDLDPRRNCKPVNCVQKYNGKRNYFRKATKLCEPVHECFTKLDAENLPTSAFDKDHNRCKSLIQNKLTKEEEQNVKKDMEKNMDASQKKKFRNIDANDPSKIPIKCNHGKRVGSICVCDEGWKTDTSKVPLGDPKFVYNWCNVRTRKKPFLPYKQQKYFMITGLSLTSFVLVVAWVWMLYRNFFQKDGVHKFEARKTVSKKSPLKGKRELKATTQLIEELTNKNTLKETTEFAASGQLSNTGAPERSIASENSTSKGKLLKDASTQSIVDHGSAVYIKRKTVRKGRSTVQSTRQSVRSVSTASLASHQSSLKLGDKSVVYSREKSPKGLSTSSLAGETTNTSFSGTCMKQDRSDTSFANQTSKHHSTYSLAGEAKNASSIGKLTQEERLTQMEKGGSAFSPPGEVSNVSLSGKAMKDIRGATLSDTPIPKDRYSAACGPSNISFSGKLTEDVNEITPHESQNSSAYSAGRRASSVSLAGEVRRVDGSTMSSMSQSRKGQSTYPLADQDNSSPFTAELISGASNIRQSLKVPVSYSVTGEKISTASSVNESFKEKKQGTMSGSQSTRSGSLGNLRPKDSSSSSIKGSGRSQNSNV